MNQPELGKKVLMLRAKKGLTQTELAEKCNVSLRTIQRIESADVMPRSQILKLIFSSLDYDLYDQKSRLSLKLTSFLFNVKSVFLHTLNSVFDLFNLKTQFTLKIALLAFASTIIFTVF